MRLLLFSDLHTSLTAARNLMEMAEAVDVLVGAGDFGMLRKDIGACFDVLCEIKKPAVLVAGNHESADELKVAAAGWPSAVVLQAGSSVIDGVTFFGIGGGIPTTPFGRWSWDFTEEMAEQFLSECPPNAVLISHSPPFGCVDKNGHGDSVGSKAVRTAINRLQPRLVVCGHIHASGGQHEMLGKTPVVNAGPGGVVWEL